MFSQKIDFGKFLSKTKLNIFEGKFIGELNESCSEISFYTNFWHK